jgi:hypothetical protein
MALLAGALQGGASPVVSRTNEHFETVGLDRRSVAFIDNLGRHSVAIARRYLERERMALPTPILVSLRPAETVSFDRDYRLALGPRGFVRLDFRWTEGLSFRATCRGLAEALLLQHSRFNFGPAASEQLRQWTIDALAEEIYLSLRPALIGEAREASRATPPTELGELLRTVRLAEEGLAEREGYWFLEALKATGLRRERIRLLFEQAVAGMDIEAALTSALPLVDREGEAVDLETWWPLQRDQLLQRDSEVVESMSTSRQWLAALANFDAPLILPTGEHQLDWRSLRIHRENEQVRRWLEARLEILRLRITRINPSYYNAAQSLGALFETSLSEAPRHEYLRALTFYLSDWEDAQAMESAVQAALDEAAP